MIRTPRQRAAERRDAAIVGLAATVATVAGIACLWAMRDGSAAAFTIAVVMTGAAAITAVGACVVATFA